MNGTNAGNASLIELDDEALIALIGDESSKAALRIVYDRYRRSLGSFLRGKIQQDRVVDELYNDVMLVVWQKARDFRGDAKASTWIFGIAYRLCMSEIRKNQRQPLTSSEFELDEMVDNSTIEADSAPADDLQLALRSLTEEHREVIQLAYYHGHSVADISELMCCPVNTVKTRLFHARQKLKAKIEIDNKKAALGS